MEGSNHGNGQKRSLKQSALATNKRSYRNCTDTLLYLATSPPPHPHPPPPPITAELEKLKLTQLGYKSCMHAVVLVPRPSHCQVSDHLQYAKMEGKGGGGRSGSNYHMDDVNVCLSGQRGGGARNQKNMFCAHVHRPETTSSKLFTS